MSRSWRNFLSILAAVSMIVVVMTGAAVTSSHGQPTYRGLLNVHVAVGIVVTLLIGLAIYAWGVERLGLTRFFRLVVLALLFEIWLGYPRSAPIGPLAGTLHATLAAFLFTAVTVIALLSSGFWRRDPDLVRDYGWPSLRFLSTAASFLLAVQVAFGAGIRHSAAGVMPHLLGALVVALFILILGAFVTHQFPKHATLRLFAIVLMVITGVQVVLGLTVFLMRMMNVAGTNAWLGISVAHVVTGNLTFAASVMLAIEIRRNVLPREISGS